MPKSRKPAILGGSPALRARRAYRGEEFFCADQNVRLVNNAERYYRSVFHGCDEWCNPCYTHILDTAHFAPISTAAERKIVICVRISEMRARTQAADG